MTESSDSFNNFVSEFKQSLAQPAGEAILRRINTERLLQLVADELIENHEAQRIRILPDARMAGEAGADFLLQIDDYDVRLELLDSNDGKASLSQDKLISALQLLEDNPSTAALVFVWTTDDLLAIYLSLARIRYIEQQPDRLERLLKEAQPLSNVLKAIIARQVKQWEFVLQPAMTSNTRPADIRQLFEQAIGEAIDIERERTYKNVERRLAAHQFPVEAEKQLIYSVLKDALQGAIAKDLVPRLTRLPRRGGK